MNAKVAAIARFTVNVANRKKKKNRILKVNEKLEAYKQNARQQK